MLLRELEIAREMSLASAAASERVVAIHEDTLRAIMSGDPELIEIAMDEHLRYLEDIWEEETGTARLRKVPSFLLPHTGRDGAGAPPAPA